MPIYEYACTSCGERTEARQGFEDPPLEDCPHCGGRLRKLYSPVGVVFKGSGFYSTDAKSSKATKKDSAAKTDGSKTTDTKTESKSSTTETKSSSGSSDS